MIKKFDTTELDKLFLEFSKKIKEAMTVEDWCDLKNISEDERKNYPNAAEAYDRKNTKLAKALK